MNVRAMTVTVCLFWAMVCHSAAPTPLSAKEAGIRNKILRMGVNVSGFDTLDPHFAAAFADRILADMVFSGLIRYKPGLAPELEPDLALNIPEPVTLNGKQTWTFRLRENVFFHSSPGRPAWEMTAADVVRSFEKAMDPDCSAYAGGYEGIAVEAIDRRTARFTVDPPQSPLLFLPKVVNYAGGFVAAGAGGGQDRNRPPLVGTGPFAIHGPTAGGAFLLEPHSAYFRGTPRLAGVEIHFIPDSIQRIAALDSNRLDLICAETSAAWLAQVADKQHIIIDSFGVPETSCIHFNTLYPPFSDARVRKAVAYSLNRDLFLVPFGKDMVQNAFSPAPTYMPGGLGEQEVTALHLSYSRDIARARNLLAQAGYKDGFTFAVWGSELAQIKANYQTLKTQLAQVGIIMNIRLTDHASYHKKIRTNANPLVIYEAFRPNTDELLSRFFHSESTVVTGRKMATNFSNYTGIDHLIEQARSERITSRQIKLWEYAQIKLLEDMVVYPLHYRKQTYVRKTWVDFGHPLKNTAALYPQITERTRLVPHTGRAQ